MVNWFYVVTVTICLGFLPLSGCSQRPMPTSTTEKLQLAVSILPQKYFVERIGGEYVSVEVMVEPEVGGTEPIANELATLMAEAKKEKIKVIFAQPEFSTRDAETIAQEIGGEVLLLDPLAADWLENLRYVSQQLAQVLSQIRIPSWRLRSAHWQSQSPYSKNHQPTEVATEIALTTAI